MTEKQIAEAHALTGAEGGRAGRGKAKKRSAAHYKRIQAMAIEARRKKAAAKKESDLF